MSMSSLLNAELTRWGTALNAFARMFIRAAVSVSAGILSACFILPDFFINMLPDSVIEAPSVSYIIDQFSTWNNLLPLAESFLCITLVSVVNLACFAFKCFRVTVKTVDDINPIG